MFEGIVTAILLVVIGAIPVVPVVLSGETWGAEPSIGAALMVLGVLVLWIELRTSVRKGTPR